MTDLTLLHAPSTLYLPEAKETGLRFTFSRRSLPPPPLISTPMVTVEMVYTGSPPPSPAAVKDNSLLSPPRRSFRSKRNHRVSPSRSSSAPPGRSSDRTRTIAPLDCLSLSSRPKTPNSAPCRSSSIPVVVRPPTTLCACIVSCSQNIIDIFPSPSKAILEEYPAFSCYWDILRLVASPYSPRNVHRCRT